MLSWTNNSSANDNHWSIDTTAVWQVTGELPSWVTGDLSDVKPVFVFSQQPELTSQGDTFVGTGTVSYDSDSNTLTVSESIPADWNNWTVQVQQPAGNGVLRWPGWGAVSAKWADPGCVAWDANEGDLTHNITRTFELHGESGWQEMNFTGSDSGSWRVRYDIPGGASTTRTVDISSPADEQRRSDDDTDSEPGVIYTPGLFLSAAYTIGGGNCGGDVMDTLYNYITAFVPEAGTTLTLRAVEGIFHMYNDDQFQLTTRSVTTTEPNRTVLFHGLDLRQKFTFNSTQPVIASAFRGCNVFGTSGAPLVSARAGGKTFILTQPEAYSSTSPGTWTAVSAYGESANVTWPDGSTAQISGTNSSTYTGRHYKDNPQVVQSDKPIKLYMSSPMPRLHDPDYPTHVMTNIPDLSRCGNLYMIPGTMMSGEWGQVNSHIDILWMSNIDTVYVWEWYPNDDGTQWKQTEIKSSSGPIGPGYKYSFSTSGMVTIVATGSASDKLQIMQTTQCYLTGSKGSFFDKTAIDPDTCVIPGWNTRINNFGFQGWHNGGITEYKIIIMCYTPERQALKFYGRSVFTFKYEKVIEEEIDADDFTWVHSPDIPGADFGLSVGYYSLAVHGQNDQPDVPRSQVVTPFRVESTTLDPNVKFHVYVLCDGGYGADYHCPGADWTYSYD